MAAHWYIPRRQAHITAGYTCSAWNTFHNVPAHSDIRQVAIKADYVLRQQSEIRF